MMYDKRYDSIESDIAKLYDKRDGLRFHIINFPFVSIIRELY